MQQAQKAAAEAKAQSNGALRLIGHGGIVQFQLFQSFPQILVLGAIGRVHAGKHHGLHRPVAGQCLPGRSGGLCDRVAHPGVGDGLNGSRKIAYLPGSQLLCGAQAQGMHRPHLHYLVHRPSGHHLHIHTGPDGPLLHPKVDDDAPVGVVLAVKNQCLEGCGPVAGGGRDVGNNPLQNGVDVDPVFCGNLRRILRRDANDVLNLRFHLGRPGSRQINFIDHRQNLQAGVNGQVGVGQGLGLHALGGVHHQHRTLAGSQGTGDLIVEVHMARGVNQIQVIGLPIVSCILQTHRPGLDGNAPLPL